MIRINGKHALSAALVAGLLALSGTAGAAVLHPGQSLSAGQTLPANNGRYAATMQADGNLVVYRSDGTVIWATWTQGSGAAAAHMQVDGNFVLYTADGRPVWSTGTWGRDRVFTVDNYGRASVLAIKKWHSGGDVEHLRRTGSKLVWIAPEWDVPSPRPRPRGPHCIGDPRACGHSNVPIGDGTLKGRLPFG